LLRDPDGRYRIDLRYTDAKGGAQRYKERFPLGTPAAAARAHAQTVLVAALSGTLTKRGAEAPTRLKAAFEQYRALTAPANPKQKERHCAQLLKAFGDVPLSDVTELSIERFKRERSKGKAPSTVNRELQTLRHFLNLAVEWGWIEARPKVRLFKEPPGRVRWLTDAERDKLEAELPVRFKRLVMAASLCGQRLSDVINLTRDRVDLDNQTFWIPKTKSGKRHDVPISGPLGAVIRDAMADGDAMAVAGKALEPLTHVFLSRLGGPYTSSGVSGLFRKCVERAGVKDFHFHDLRHDYATKIRRAGHGLDVVQRLLGHASPVMSQRYAHIGQSELHAAVEAVGRDWGRPRIAPALPPGKSKSAKKPRKK
jgi:integrase